MKLTPSFMASLLGCSMLLGLGTFSCSSIGLTKNKLQGGSSAAKTGISTSPTKTVVYVKNSTDPLGNSLDIYKPSNVKAGTKSPIMIYVHGGGFANGDKARVLKKPSYFNQKGYVFVSTNYRLAASQRRVNKNPVKHPAQVQDLAAAIAWVRSNANEFGGDPNRIFLMGHSSGAHLVALVSTDEKYLKAQKLNLSVIRGTIGLDTGFYDLAQTVGNRPSGERMIENAFGNDPKVWKDASPISHVQKGKNIPPFLLTYTTKRKQEVNLKFANSLKGSGVQVVLVDSLDKTHEAVNTEIGEPNSSLTVAVTRFLDSILQNKTLKSDLVTSILEKV
jgi:arylformamidase